MSKSSKIITTIAASVIFFIIFSVDVLVLHSSADQQKIGILSIAAIFGLIAAIRAIWKTPE